VLALLTSGLTASIALEQCARLPLPPPFRPGAAAPPPPPGAAARPRTVLVTAAAGGTGQFAVQLARLAGCRVVATCGGGAKAELLRRLGADRVIDYT
jgi:NADPH:quinone reductase-like Zn-dependent oxidoreductase